MKKLFITLSLLLFSPSCFAQIGYVNYSTIYKNLPVSQQYQKRIDAKAQEVRKYNLETQALAKQKSTYDEKVKVRDDRKENLYKIERDYINLRYKQEAVVREKVKTAAEIIRAQKGLEAIIDKKSVVVGGVDCTSEILKAIK